MNYNGNILNELIRTSEALMVIAYIPLRDTWTGLEGENMDDAIQNNGNSGGPRLLSVVFTPDGTAAVKGHGTYYPKQFACAAYDSYKI